MAIKKKNKPKNYEAPTYTAHVDSRLVGNWTGERDQRYTRYRDLEVPPSKKKKKIRAKMVK